MSEERQEMSSFVAPPLEELDGLLNGYKFESFIAKGGMGAVYLARQTSLDRPVAVKVLPREFSEDEEFINSFQSEAKLMAKLNHPNLIGIYDFGSIDGMLYIIMEFVKGKSLHHSAYGKAISPDTAVEIMSAICAGLAHAHDAGVLHRDIKPANILLGPNAEPKIGDFGLARLNGMTESGVIYGTPGYAAPEVLDAPDKVDNRTDVFAVGVMFYELLTGRLPKGKYVSITEWVDADPKYDKIIKKAIHSNIDMRYRSAQDFADDINDVLDNPTHGSKLLVTSAASSRALSVKMPTVAAPVDVGNRVAGMNNYTDAAVPVATAVMREPVRVTLPQGVSDDSSKVMRNILLIFLLIGAIYAVTEMQRSRQDKIDAGIAREKAAEKEERAEFERKAAEAKAKREAALAEAMAISAISKGPQNAYSKVEKLTRDQQLKRIGELLGDIPMPDFIVKDSIFMRDRGARLLMYVDKKMTWDEADAWTRGHGGYIAVCRTKSDLTVFANQMPEGVDEVWLGVGCGGNNGWRWVDDTEWDSTLNLTPTYKRSFAKLSKSQLVSVSKSEDLSGFFIEWRADGSLPADMSQRLLRVSDTLSDINPSYPAGSVTLGSRSYCLIKDSVTRAEAEELAIIAGGHLVVISDDDERAELSDFVSNYLQPGERVWTAAEKVDGKWSWLTGEVWSDVKWHTSHPKDGDAAVFFGPDSLSLKDIDSKTKANGFIVEWSEDSMRNSVSRLEGGRYSLSTLNAEAKGLLEQHNQLRERHLKASVVKLGLDLDVYLRVVSGVQDSDESKVIKKLLDSLKGKSRLPEVVEGVDVSERLRQYVAQCREKQIKYDFTYRSNVEQLRSDYVKQLKKVRDRLTASGQTDVAKSLIEAASKIGDSAEDFEDYLK